MLAAPTGRAAKRLTELSGHPATTVHRLLQLRPGGDPSFDRDHPLDADLIVVDEASMLDLILANKLIKAVPPGAHLLLVGDVDQLPSVGAGEVLRDLLAADTIPRVRLTQIFRQAQQSGVVVNAHRINAGQPPAFGEHPDFFLFPADEPEATAERVVDLVARRIPAQVRHPPAGHPGADVVTRLTATSLQTMARMIWKPSISSSVVTTRRADFVSSRSGWSAWTTATPLGPARSPVDLLQTPDRGHVVSERRLQAVVDLLIEELARGFGHERLELLANLGSNVLPVDARGEQADPLGAGVLELGRPCPLDLADVLQLLSGIDHRVEVEGLPGQLGQFGQERRVDGSEVEDEKAACRPSCSGRRGRCRTRRLRRWSVRPPGRWSPRSSGRAGRSVRSAGDR